MSLDFVFRLDEWQTPMNDNPETKIPALFDLISEAQMVITDLPMGGIGIDGPTQEDIDAAEKAGKPIADDSCYHQGQKAWLILERAKNILVKLANGSI